MGRITATRPLCSNFLLLPLAACRPSSWCGKVFRLFGLRGACPTSNDGKARPPRLEAKLIRRQELSRVRAKRAHSRRRANLAMSMTTLDPISLAPSVARTANSICRPSTFVTSASAVTRRPTGVAAR
jgi:hypothetical protein